MDRRPPTSPWRGRAGRAAASLALWMWALVATLAIFFVILVLAALV